MTTTIFLVRHGAHDRPDGILLGRRSGVPLSGLGEAEARRLGARLAGENLAAIYTSPTLRAMRTAAIIGEACDLVPEELSAFDEIDFGDWTNASIADLADDPLWHDWNTNRSQASARGGEAMRAVQQRVVAAIDRCTQQHPNAAVALVGHCDPIRAAVLHHLRMPLDAIERLEVSIGSLTVIATGVWGSRLLLLNEVPHGGKPAECRQRLREGPS